jgi:methyltransferase-like protein 23
MVDAPNPILETTVGDVPLGECRVAVGGRELTVQYAAAFVSAADEVRFLVERAGRLPYGVTLWPSAIALAHEIATRTPEFAGRTVLEIGAGTGLPGIVAAASGAAVVQTDRQELALHLCKLNAEKNGIAGVEHRLADWTAWDDRRKYDWIIGADVLYAAEAHPVLRRIFEGNLAPGGRVLLADPFRATGMPLLEALETDGWKVTHSRWSIGEGEDARQVAVYELSPPTASGAK